MILKAYDDGGGPDITVRDLVCGIDGMPDIIRERNDFFVFFADKVYPRLSQEMSTLAALYSSDRGRPAENPVRLLAVCLLQYCERLPDRQAAEACQFNVRWKLALHLKLYSPAFHPTLLTKFRNRLLEHSMERLAFDACLDLLVKEGWIRPRGSQRLDSTHVHGLVATMSRLECMRTALKKALIALEDAGRIPEPWGAMVEEYVHGKVDFKSSRETLMGKARQAGAAAAEVLGIFRDSPEMQIPEMQLLDRVFQENYEADDAGGWTQKPKSQPGSVQNPHDPEAQWCTKSTTKDKCWTGYKVQVAETESETPRTGGEPTANFITAIVTQTATASDEAGMDEIFEQLEQNDLGKPGRIYVDGAYVSGECLAEAEAEARELRGPAQPPGGRQELTSDHFNVDIDARTATCPAGHASTNCSRLVEEATGKVSYRIEWNQALCGGCTLAAKCLGKNQAHRTLTVSQFHMHLQKRRREMATTEFKMEMHRRNGIEGTISELVRGHGMRRARGRGLARVTMQNYFIGTACNIKRLARRMAWENRKAA
jgi:transposase